MERYNLVKTSKIIERSVMKFNSKHSEAGEYIDLGILAAAGFFCDLIF